MFVLSNVSNCFIVHFLEHIFEECLTNEWTILITNHTYILVNFFHMSSSLLMCENILNIAKIIIPIIKIVTICINKIIPYILFHFEKKVNA